MLTTVSVPASSQSSSGTCKIRWSAVRMPFLVLTVLNDLGDVAPLAGQAAQVPARHGDTCCTIV